MDPERKTRKSTKQKKIIRERRQMRIFYGCLASGIVCSLLWLIALSTDNWVYFVLPESGVMMPSARVQEQHGRPGVPPKSDDRVLVESMYAGMWRLCRVEWRNVTTDAEAGGGGGGGNGSVVDRAINATAAQMYNVKLIKHSFCVQMSFYPSPAVIKAEGLDKGMLDYRRAITGMAVVGMCVAVIANSFTFYAIRRPRYVLRRLAGCMQLGTAICLLVCIEIFNGAVSYAQNGLPLVYPRETRHLAYGFSFGLAWFCFAAFLVTGVVLLINSRKEKNADEDQPVLIGRI